MEVVVEDVVVGAGIAGLTTALALHRLGIRTLVLESSDHLRATGFAFTTWTNAWKALDVVGVGELLRREHQPLMVHEIYCVQRKTLLEILEKELPRGSIRYSSNVVSIEESRNLKLVHLADGSVLKSKVLIGCDGVNSAVAKWLGFKKPSFAGRSAIRGCAYYEKNHGFEQRCFSYIDGGIRSGFVACNDKTVYWFFTFYASRQADEEIEGNPAKMKKFVLNQLREVPDHVKAIVNDTESDNMILSPLRYRQPWEILWGNISKGNVCVAGDAFHPMPPDIGQGGCAALEDGIILARCLGEALQKNQAMRREGMEGPEEEEYRKIEMSLQSYAKERRWRAFELISTAYIVGYIQQSKDQY